MKKEIGNKRKFGLDLTRAIAILFVIYIHSFIFSKFYSQPMVGMKMFCLTGIRSLAFICVPLFIMLTGYLKYNEKEDQNHYKKIKPILVVYLLISIITIVFKYYYLGERDLINQIKGIFSFSVIGYSWYLEMYIGLFLLIPYLNKMYSCIETKEKKKKFILILLFIASIPQTLNGMKIDNYVFDILPSWWENLYPFMYYFLGCYIKDNQVKIKKTVNIILLLVVMLIQNYILYYYNYNKEFMGWGYEGFFTVLISVLVFLLLYDLNIRGKIVSGLVTKISKMSFSMYLFSFVFDTLFYTELSFIIEDVSSIFKVLVIIPPLVFICSFIASILLDYFIKMLTYIKNRIKEHHREIYNVS